MTYIFGIGRSRAQQILAEATDESKKVADWSDSEIAAIREAVSSFKIEGIAFRNQLNIKRLMDIGCYREIRHRAGLPLRGQRTKNNSRTRKGKRKTVANKKKATKYPRLWLKLLAKKERLLLNQLERQYINASFNNIIISLTNLKEK